MITKDECYNLFGNCDGKFNLVCFMQGSDRTAEERRIAICIFDDVAEHCREAALRYESLTFFPDFV